jgi:hypothetical protein
MTEPVIEGDPFGKIKQPKTNTAPEPRDVNHFHERSDKDASRTAQHHTLGNGHNQASPGDHIHDGRTGKKLGTGLNLTLTGAKGGNVALTNLITMLKNVIEFTDSTT